MEHKFTFYSYVHDFGFRHFSNISQMILGSSCILFCREFQVLSLGNKNDFNHRDKRGETLKVLRGPLFLGYPLSVNERKRFINGAES